MTLEPHIAHLRVVKKRSGQRVVVELDNGDKLEIDPEVVVRHGLKTGAALDAEAAERLLSEDEVHRARQRLTRYLALRVKSIADARSYLEKAGFSETAVDDAIEHAVDREFLDDRRFVERFVRTRLKTSTVGPLRLLAELRSHGIDTALAEEALQPQFDPQWQQRQARQLVRKQCEGKRVADPVKERKRLFDMLQRRGFEAEVANEAVGSACPADEFET